MWHRRPQPLGGCPHVNHPRLLSIRDVPAPAVVVASTRQFMASSHTEHRCSPHDINFVTWQWHVTWRKQSSCACSYWLRAEVPLLNRFLLGSSVIGINQTCKTFIKLKRAYNWPKLTFSKSSIRPIFSLTLYICSLQRSLSKYFCSVWFWPSYLLIRSNVISEEVTFKYHVISICFLLSSSDAAVSLLWILTPIDITLL